MRRATVLLTVASLLVIAEPGARAQQNPLGQLIDKAKKKLQTPVECTETDQACIDRAKRAGTPVKIVPAPRTPDAVPASSAGGAAPPPVPAAAPPAGADFAAPHPTHLALFKMWIAHPPSRTLSTV